MNDKKFAARFGALGIRFYPATDVLSVLVHAINFRSVGICGVLILDVVTTGRPRFRRFAMGEVRQMIPKVRCSEL